MPHPSSGSHLIRKYTNNNGIMFTWTIDNFIDRQDNIVKSPHFWVEKRGFRTTEWCLNLFPKGTRSDSEDHVDLSLYNVEKIPVTITYMVSILDIFLEKHKVFKSMKVDLKDGAVCLPKWLTRHKLKDEKHLLPGGQMTVYLELVVHSVSPEMSPNTRHNEDVRAKRFKEVGESFVKLLDDKELTDMTIKCGGKDFPCHSLVLSARSPVFKAMFQANMMESETKVVKIEDIEPAVVAELLHFIYTGGTNENTSQEIYLELLEAADKYDLDSLKEICEEYLCSGLGINNAVEYLILGDMCQAQKLRENALRQVAANMASIVKTESYQKLKQYPDILIEIPRAMIE